MDEMINRATFEDVEMLLQASNLEPDEAAVRAFRDALERLWEADVASEEESREESPDNLSSPAAGTTFEDADDLLQAGNLDPDETALRAFRNAAASPGNETIFPDSCTRPSFFIGKSRTRSRLWDNRFRPNLEDLGPRDLSSFAVSPLTAGLDGAATLGVMASCSQNSQERLTASSQGFSEQAWADQRPAAVPLLGGRSNDTQVLDSYFSSYFRRSSEPAELDQIWTEGGRSFVGEEPVLVLGQRETRCIFPELGAVLLAGGLRQDLDHSQPRPVRMQIPLVG
jgi:hypothetical protein